MRIPIAVFSHGFICAYFVVSSASAEFHVKVTVLEPRTTGSASSMASATSDSQQGGSMWFEDGRHAVIWSGTADSWRDIHPTGASESMVNGVHGNQWVGNVDGYAAIWLGTSDSLINLNPSGASGSEAFSTSGTQQAGYAVIGGAWHAGIWSGTAASWIDLNPAGASESIAFASGDRQVGGANIGGWHAGIWSGSADSWVDLHPAVAGSSRAFAISGNQQGGSAYVEFHEHAALWSGTADSWVDLDPNWAPGIQSTSAIYGMAEGVQVGLAEGIAGMWFGTKESWFELGSSLESPFVWSTATSVHKAGDTYFIAGYALDEHIVPSAVLWTVSPVPEPSFAAIGALGILVVWAFRRKVISR